MGRARISLSYRMKRYTGPYRVEAHCSNHISSWTQQLKYVQGFREILSLVRACNDDPFVGMLIFKQMQFPYLISKVWVDHPRKED